MKLTDKEKLSEIFNNHHNFYSGMVRRVYPKLFEDTVVSVQPLKEPARYKICIEIFV